VASHPDRAEAMQVKHRESVHLLLAHNPNYFGNLPELGIPPVIELVMDTYFEELTRVAVNPDTHVLEATVELKRAVGYGGDSTEWVRFHLSYDGGASWEDTGLASVTAYDLPDGHRPGRPVAYTVARALPDPRHRSCALPVLPLVRAILSWQIMPPPGRPGWTPVWGNVVDQHVPSEHLRATDPFFRAYRLDPLPSNLGRRAWDRTSADRAPWRHHLGYRDVGCCLG
jgi:hypothetical protein